MDRRPEPGSDGPPRKKVRTVDFATGQGLKEHIQKELATPEEQEITNKIARGMEFFDRQAQAKKGSGSGSKTEITGTADIQAKLTTPEQTAIAREEKARSKDTSVPKDDDEQIFDDWINPDAYAKSGDESGL
jgi:hypothetical protein